MKAVLFKCRAGTQFHFGKYAIDSDTALNDSSEIIHSDTLFSAIINTYDYSSNNTDEFVEKFEKGNIKLSSGYFYIKLNNKYIWFLPKPISFNLIDVKEYKSIRKIKYISKAAWEKIIDPSEIVNTKNYTIIQDIFLVCNEEISGLKEPSLLKLFYEKTITKVLVHNPIQEDSLYTLTVIEIAENEVQNQKIEIGYYFLVEGDIESLYPTLNILAMNGIGGERSTMGKIDSHEILDWNLIEFDSALFTNLGILSPAANEIDSIIYYKSIPRGGRRTGTHNGSNKLKSINMIIEGSVFKRKISGKINDISQKESPFKYKRNGVSIIIPIPKQWLYE